MDTARITEILTDPVTLDLVEKQPITQIAYAALNGSPRSVPLGYLLRDGKFLFFTIPTSEKVAAMHRDPRIALSIDVYPPPCCLLVRGTAELREEPGVPSEYLEASFRTMPENQHAEFEEQVRALYDSIVRIEVTRPACGSTDFNAPHPARSNASSRPSRADPSDESHSTVRLDLHHRGGPRPGNGEHSRTACDKKHVRDCPRDENDRCTTTL